MIILEKYERLCVIFGFSYLQIIMETTQHLLQATELLLFMHIIGGIKFSCLWNICQINHL